MVLVSTNLTLSVSVVAPPNIASTIVLCEGSGAACPWTLFQVTFGRMTTAQATMEWVHDRRPPPDGPRERSRDEFGGATPCVSKRVLQTCGRKNQGKTSLPMWYADMECLCCTRSKHCQVGQSLSRTSEHAHVLHSTTSGHHLRRWKSGTVSSDRENIRVREPM